MMARDSREGLRIACGCGGRVQVLAIVLNKAGDAIGNRIDQCCSVDSTVFCPTFAAKGEFRGELFDPTCTLYLQINTVEKLSRQVRVRSLLSLSR